VNLSLDDNSAQTFEGRFEDYVVVSVPVETPADLVAQIKDKLVEVFKTDQILVVTNNIAFWKGRKLSPKEAAEKIKIGEDYAERMAQALRSRIESRDRSGIRIIGGGDPGARHDGPSDGAGGEGAGNQEGEQESPPDNSSGNG